MLRDLTTAATWPPYELRMYHTNKWGQFLPILAEVNGTDPGQLWAAGCSTGRRSWRSVFVTTWRVLRSSWGLASRYACAPPMNGGQLYTHIWVDSSGLGRPLIKRGWEHMRVHLFWHNSILTHWDINSLHIETFERKILEKSILAQYW